MPSATRRTPIRLLHASDTHLHWEQRAESLWCIEALRVAADRHEADAVVIAGDIFDTAGQPATFIEAVAEQLNRFAAPVVLLPGNHDIRYSESESDTLGELGARLRGGHHLIDHPDGEVVDLLDGAVHLWGRGMPEHTPTNDPLAGARWSEDPRAWSIVVAHGEVVTNAARRSSPIDLDKHRAALERVDYVALGHHDEPSLVDCAHSVVCYSGSASKTLGGRTFALASLECEGVTVEIHRLSDEHEVEAQRSKTSNQ